MTDRMLRLWQEMSDLTAPECAKACKIPHSCCSPEYCDMAEEIALANDVTLEPTGHPTLKFMGATGCIVPPHLRPLCTLHTCDVNALGAKVGDPVWTDRYFDLRDQLQEDFHDS